MRRVVPILGLGLAIAWSGAAHGQPAPEAPPETPPATPAETPSPAEAPAPPAPAPVVVAPPAEPPPAEPAVEEAAAPEVSPLQIHGFISAGGFLTLDNNYIGESARGSLRLVEAGLNVSSEVADRLRASIQLFARNTGDYQDLPPRLDFAFLDYRARRWLGLRAGVIKLPYGLYNEYVDIDAARVSILMPQSVYALRNRSALLAHWGFSLYGELPVGNAGVLEYQAIAGTLDVPENALELSNAELESVDAKYVAGGQLFWRPRVEGLRIGTTFLRASIDFNVTLDAALASALIMAGLVPMEFDGKVVVSQRPVHLAIGSVEYLRDAWTFAAEYARTYDRQTSTLPTTVLPTQTEKNERFYVMVNRRWSRCLETGLYYSVFHKDADDRRGRGMQFAERYHAFQRDLTASVRYDVNDRWLWKAEAHFIDGTADLAVTKNPDPKRYWGMFLFKTTVTF